MLILSYTIMENEAHNVIQLISFVPKWSHRLLNNYKGLTFYIKIYVIMHKKLNLRFWNFKSIFQRTYFLSVDRFQHFII